jgi:hypothetical protein
VGAEQLLVDLILLVEKTHIQQILLAELANVELYFGKHPHEDHDCGRLSRAFFPGGFSLEGEKAVSKKTGFVC